MLKTNSKKAIENIRKYIVENFHVEFSEVWETADEVNDFNEIAKYIYNDFWRVEGDIYKQYIKAGRHISKEALFYDYCQGLPGILDTKYFYSRSAVDDLGEILEQTETEKAKYTEGQAEKTFTNLIFRELTKVL